jgi:hypothetical protein
MFHTEEETENERIISNDVVEKIKIYELFCNLLPKTQISFADIYHGFDNAPVVMWDTQIRFDSMYAVPKLRH